MKTIGGFLKESREKRRFSRERLEKETKIKKEFIEALEKEDWRTLPEYPVVQGFVKSISGILKTNQKQTIALLRRDYPPQKLRIIPKPDVSEKFSWSPRLSFIVGITLVSLMVVGYLVSQYINFMKPPKLEVFRPLEGQVVSSRKLTVTGVTDTDAIIRINNQPVLLDSDGGFVVEIEISEKTTEIIVKAVSRSGKETEVVRGIKTEF